MRDDHDELTGRNPARSCAGGNHGGRKTIQPRRSHLIQVRVLDAAQGVWKPGLALVPAKPAHYGHGILSRRGCAGCTPH